MSQLNISRRGVLAGGGAAVVAGSATGWLQPAMGQGAAQPLPIANPYAAAVITGPSSQAVAAIGATASAPGSPYILPVQPGWSVTSLITAGNEIKGYRMAGVPDGLGAFDNGDGTITVLMNHEIGAGDGAMRGHGGSGAFVSRWVIDTSTLEVTAGRDFVTDPDKLHLWSDGGWVTGSLAAAAAVEKAAVVAAKLLEDAAIAAAKAAELAAAATSAARAVAGTSSSAVVADAAPTVSKLAAVAPPQSLTTVPTGPAAIPPGPAVISSDPRDIERLCSADLAPISAFYNSATKLGYDGHIFLNGEEGEGRINRAFAWVVDESAVYQLPQFSFGIVGDDVDAPPEWENLLANPASGDATVVIANSDGGPSKLFVYIGRKKASGSAVERAGLVGGHLHTLQVIGTDSETRTKNIGIAKSRLGKGKGKPVALTSLKKGTDFQRPEDGAWDPVRPNVYYFTTTDRNNFVADGSVGPTDDKKQIGRARLWAVTFDSVKNIATNGSRVGKIEMLLDGTEGGDMFDNITVDRNGVVYLCEDTGEARHAGKVWAYDTKSGKLTTIMRFDPAKFGTITGTNYTPPTAPFIDDKETSGILDVTDLFKTAKWFRSGSTVLLIDVQAHFGYSDADPVGAVVSEGGQLLLLVKAP